MKDIEMLKKEKFGIITSRIINKEQYYTVEEIALLLQYSERWVRAELYKKGFKKTGAKYLIKGTLLGALLTDNCEMLPVKVVE